MFTQKLREKLTAIDSLLANAAATAASSDLKLLIANKINDLLETETRYLTPNLEKDADTVGMIYTPPVIEDEEEVEPEEGVTVRHAAIKAALATFYNNPTTGNATTLRSAVDAHMDEQTDVVYPAFRSNFEDEDFRTAFLANIQA